MAASAQSSVSFRWATASDYDVLGQVMYAAIHATPSPYTPEQRKAWCPKPPAGMEWKAKLAAQHVAIAERDQGPVGFVTLDQNGYLDLAFLLPDARGQGSLRYLLSMIVAHANDGSLAKITTHASLAAQAPFAALGFDLVRHETISRDGQTLQRAEMHLPLKTTRRDGQNH